MNSRENSLNEKVSAGISASVCGDNVFALHVNTTVQDQSPNSEAQSINDNVVSIKASAESAGLCVDGVCSISWKPKRPSAA